VVQLLHNELIPDIPFKLKIKMAFQAAKGMHFLHSSGIVHRDLKSLNLLLDSKWNVKVSDFGLTKFKADASKGSDDHGNGTVYWTAPEVLNESQDVDHVLADVYSFGIILWELLTREQPHPGMRYACPRHPLTPSHQIYVELTRGNARFSPAAVAVAVIRNGLRPEVPKNVSEEATEFVELMRTCWHDDPTIRPTFLEVMTRLSSSIDKSRSSYTSNTSSRYAFNSSRVGLPSSSQDRT
jgi:serine/threonine protein kinase